VARQPLLLPFTIQNATVTISCRPAYLHRRGSKRGSALLRRITLVLLMIASPALAQKTEHRLVELAAAGHIDENAPVRASSEILILAPIDKVWKLLSAIDDWPKWQSTISSSRTSGPLQPGTEFIWISGGTKIKSRLAVVVPNTDVAWTGTAFGAKAIHIWHLKAPEEGRTLVSTEESMSGFMLKIFYSSKDLEKSQRAWLEALKRASEK
jgi:hypothetical protein